MHAGLMAAAFAPVHAWPLAAAAPAPLVWAAWTARVVREQAGHVTGRSAGMLTAPVLISVGTVPLWAFEQWWVREVSWPGYLALVALLAAFAGLFAALMQCVMHRLAGIPLTLAVPVLWVGVEVLRGEVAFTGYPWLLIGHPLIESRVLARPGALVGQYGVGFLAAMVCGAACDAVLRGRLRPAVVGAGAALGAWCLAPLLDPVPVASGPGLRVAVVQTNVPQSNKIEWSVPQRLDDFARFEALTLRASETSPPPDVIVWPETMFPGVALDDWLHRRLAAQAGALPEAVEPLLPLRERLQALSARTPATLLIGALGYDPPTAAGDFQTFNSVFVVAGGSVCPRRYDKMALTPFGEFMPYVSAWPWAERLLLAIGAPGLRFDLSPGREWRVLDVPIGAGTRRGRGGERVVAVGTPICFEAVKSEACRRLGLAAGGRPVVLVNLTNDGWFGSFDSGRWQHFQIARWRALELGVPVVRAANTGVSGAIARDGSVLVAGTEAGAARVAGVMVATVIPAIPDTLFVRGGWVFPWVVLGAAGGLVAWAGFRYAAACRRERRS